METIKMIVWVVGILNVMIGVLSLMNPPAKTDKKLDETKKSRNMLAATALALLGMALLFFGSQISHFFADCFL